jgi:hypothetical protein
MGWFSSDADKAKKYPGRESATERKARIEEEKAAAQHAKRVARYRRNVPKAARKGQAWEDADAMRDLRRRLGHKP